MKKGLLVFSALLVLLGILSACGTKSSSNVLTIGTEATYPPFSYRDSNNNLTGYDVDVAKEVAKRIGMTPQFVPTPWKGMILSLDSKRFDMIANQVTITDERKQKYAFSTPYTISGGEVIVNKDNNTIKSISDLKGKTVGTTQGSNYDKTAQAAGANVKYYGDIAQVLSDLNVKRVDAALNDKLFILTQMKKMNLNVKEVGQPFDKNEMAFAFRKDDKNLVNKVNKALADMKKDGTLEKISKKYFGANVSE